MDDNRAAFHRESVAIGHEIGVCGSFRPGFDSGGILSEFFVDTPLFFVAMWLTLLRRPSYCSERGCGDKNWNGSMGRLEIAEGRLDRALTRLEAAATRPRIGDTQSELERELTAARARCYTLENTTQEVSGRLDATIARIYAILESDHGPG
jgi:hypothetical protein